MSTESNTSNTAHTIRMSDEDWNELLVTAINTGYKSRTEYIRAILKTNKLWQMKEPDAEMDAAIANAAINTKWQDATASLEVITNDAVRFLARAEAAEAKVAQLQAELQAATLPILENPQSLKHELDTANARIEHLNSLIRSATENKPLRGLKEIVADMPEKTRAKWDVEKWKAETWVKYFLENK